MKFVVQCLKITEIDIGNPYKTPPRTNPHSLCGKRHEIELRQEEVESGDWSRPCPRCGGRLTRKDVVR